MYIVFRENKCKGFGIIKKVIYDESNLPPFKRIIKKRKQTYNTQTQLKREANRKARINNNYDTNHTPKNKFSIKYRPST